MKKDKVEKAKKVSKKKNRKSFIETIGSFFVGVKKEFLRIKWPTGKNLIKYSVATIVFIIFFALFFYGIDVVIALVKTVIKNG